MKTIGQRIRAAREARGWTIREMAIRTSLVSLPPEMIEQVMAALSAGFTEDTISGVERGVWIPSERVLRAVEKALNEKLRK